MSSCAVIIGRQRTTITFSFPSPFPTLFYHCLLSLWFHYITLSAYEDIYVNHGQIQLLDLKDKSPD